MIKNDLILEDMSTKKFPKVKKLTPSMKKFPFQKNNKLIQHFSQIKNLHYGLESFYKEVDVPVISSRT